MTNIISRETLANLDSDTMKQMTKPQLIEHLARAVEIINVTKAAKTGDTRKTQVVQMLLEKPCSTLDIANALDTTTKNVSSIFFGLKKDGLIMFADDNGRKFFAKPEQAHEYLIDPETFKARRVKEQEDTDNLLDEPIIDDSDVQ